ncbi:hypothetical protein QR98_0002260 [Sarcoptes scabiei]|uniref:Uncharacterized protein n=1 Tax=Sarcoptes scabiei TaxID=52283 RepID=A0A131ZSV6_SARSC|nr:hypothetical protein QR98_0002260 [Sarcoptes scabiei]
MATMEMMGLFRAKFPSFRYYLIHRIDAVFSTLEFLSTMYYQQTSSEQTLEDSQDFRFSRF